MLLDSTEFFVRKLQNHSFFIYTILRTNLSWTRFFKGELFNDKLIKNVYTSNVKLEKDPGNKKKSSLWGSRLESGWLSDWHRLAFRLEPRFFV